MQRRLRNFLTTDWLPEDKRENIPLRTFYIQLEWKKKVTLSRPYSTELQDSLSLNELVKSLKPDTTDVSAILITGTVTGILNLTVLSVNACKFYKPVNSE